MQRCPRPVAARALGEWTVPAGRGPEPEPGRRLAAAACSGISLDFPGFHRMFTRIPLEFNRISQGVLGCYQEFPRVS